MVFSDKIYGNPDFKKMSFGFNYNVIKDFNNNYAVEGNSGVPDFVDDPYLNYDDNDFNNVYYDYVDNQFFLNYTLEFQPIPGIIFESAWTTSELNWSGSVLLEGGTEGVIKMTTDFSHDANPTEVDGGNFWGQLDKTFGGLQRYKVVSKNLGSLFNQELSKLESVFENTHSHFVLPAGSTFAFKNPQFDSYQNLLLNITYKTKEM